MGRSPAPGATAGRGPEGEDGPTRFWLSDLPDGTPVADLVRLAKIRWRIEHDYRELKHGLGLDRFEAPGRTGTTTPPWSPLPTPSSPSSGWSQKPTHRTHPPPDPRHPPRPAELLGPASAPPATDLCPAERHQDRSWPCLAGRTGPCCEDNQEAVTVPLRRGRSQRRCGAPVSSAVADRLWDDAADVSLQLARTWLHHRATRGGTAVHPGLSRSASLLRGPPAKLLWRMGNDYREMKQTLDMAHFEGQPGRLSPPRHPRLNRPYLLHPAATEPIPKRDGAGLSLHRVVHERQLLLVIWTGARPTCHRDMPNLTPT
ncbi:hypothetical protein QF027_009744 [Streptomyces canus]|nr:hypothetical protein [Streptomyces canus]